jgi:hypothetical protein
VEEGKLQVALYAKVFSVGSPELLDYPIRLSGYKILTVDPQGLGLRS